jgi:predicted dehydrogenase
MVGAGMISRHHLLAWSKVKGAAVVAICDPEPSRAVARAAEFNIAAIYRSPAEMVAREKLDAVDVASTPETHTDVVRLCASYKLPTLCQKPLAPTLTEAEQLVAEVSDMIRLMVHENWRFRPYFREIKNWLQEGRLGRISACRLAYRSSGLLARADGVRPALTRQPYMQFQEHLMMREILIHHLDVARWLLGPLQVVGAVAAATVADLPGETSATILLRSETGAPVIVEGNLTAAGLPALAEDDVEFIGERASVMFADGRLDRLGEDPARLTFESADAYQASFNRAIQHFAECLASGATFETDARENLATLRLLDAAERAAGRDGTSQLHLSAILC